MDRQTQVSYYSDINDISVKSNWEHKKRWRRNKIVREILKQEPTIIITIEK